MKVDHRYEKKMMLIDVQRRTEVHHDWWYKEDHHDEILIRSNPSSLKHDHKDRRKHFQVKFYSNVEQVEVVVVLEYHLELFLPLLPAVEKKKEGSLVTFVENLPFQNCLEFHKLRFLKTKKIFENSIRWLTRPTRMTEHRFESRCPTIRCTWFDSELNRNRWKSLCFSIQLTNSNDDPCRKTKSRLDFGSLMNEQAENEFTFIFVAQTNLTYIHREQIYKQL